MRWLWLVMLGEMLFTAAFFLLLPAISRRGLLFGVYIGEERSTGDPAQRIRRRWYTGMVATLVVSLATVFALGVAFPRVPVGPFVSMFVLLAGYLVLYLRAYFEARALAVGEVTQAVAALVPDEPAGLVLPLIAVAIGLAGGIVSVAYAAAYYDAMPARIPTHFGMSGRPDAWSSSCSWSASWLSSSSACLRAVSGRCPEVR
jgi:uncharacterized membrane protein